MAKRLPGLRWPALDADVYVPALLDGVSDSRSWMKRGDIAGHYGFVAMKFGNNDLGPAPMTAGTAA